jgi:hypothetical protein
MHADQEPYRELHDIMVSPRFEPSRTLPSWLERNEREVTWLDGLRLRSTPTSAVGAEDLWRLYALSRVLQLLTLAFQEGEADGAAWRGPAIELEDWVGFAEGLGLSVVFPAEFSPFDCEIVHVAEGPELDMPITVTSTHWPALLLGDMLISRAGVSVVGGARAINAGVAATSTLYWAYRRKNRPSTDLSRGWGNNSQWRTAFRRDFRIDGRLFLNVDAEVDLAQEDPPPPHGWLDHPLTREERIELLAHRSFVVTNRDDRDLYPYSDKLLDWLDGKWPT